MLFNRNMENDLIFDKIYKEGLWGVNSDGVSISGTGSHENKIIYPYIINIIDFLLEKRPLNIVDLGCGDFHIGKYFTAYVNQYIACDVSKVVLERNKNKFSSLSNVDFRFLDLSKNDLPEGDVCFVRQVLQHLSNADILNFVNKVNLNKPYKYLIVTEHLPKDRNFDANLDLKSGRAIRLFVNKSGVVLHKPPFNLSFTKDSNMLDVYQYGGVIKTVVYEF